MSDTPARAWLVKDETGKSYVYQNSFDAFRHAERCEGEVVPLIEAPADWKDPED